MKIDAHQHFWKYDPVRDSWIDDKMYKLRRDFMPEDLQLLLEKNGINGCVAVQADQSEDETKFLLDLAKNDLFIKAVIGWIDLRANDVKGRLSYFAQNEKFKGVRHILQAESVEFMTDQKFIHGISCLESLGLTYDILVYPVQLPDAIQLVSQFPNQRFVLDHLAKPDIQNQNIKTWERDIRTLARLENTYCKISGLVTEANWKNWKKEDFKPYLDVVFEAFGVDRMMFGSDWPVCLVSCQYEKVLHIVETYIDQFSQGEKDRIMGLNACEFYNLKD